MSEKYTFRMNGVHLVLILTTTATAVNMVHCGSLIIAACAMGVVCFLVYVSTK